MAAGEDGGVVLIRLRMSAHDAHYGGNLVDGARILSLFGDVATELLIRHDGDEGLFVAYDLVEFRCPCTRATTSKRAGASRGSERRRARWSSKRTR